MKIMERTVQVKDLLTKSNLPASDYVINPYVDDRSASQTTVRSGDNLLTSSSAAGQSAKRDYRAKPFFSHR